MMYFLSAPAANSSNAEGSADWALSTTSTCDKAYTCLSYSAVQYETTCNILPAYPPNSTYHKMLSALQAYMQILASKAFLTLLYVTEEQMHAPQRILPAELCLSCLQQLFCNDEASKKFARVRLFVLMPTAMQLKVGSREAEHECERPMRKRKQG